MATALLAGTGLGVVATSPIASAYPSATVSFVGHGFGHGHGMGQWGALGYALAGTSYQSIVGYYYGGTALTGLSAGQEATQVHVAMTENNGNSVIVTSGAPFTVAGQTVNPGQAVEMLPTGSNQWSIFIAAAGGCAGPWPVSPTATGVSNPMAVSNASASLQLCQAGPSIPMMGSIEATYNSDGAPRTLNIVPLEQYVSDVVPNESPASWGALGGAGPQGQPWGFQELEAQAVAARSYVMAGVTAGTGSYATYANGAYADICDLTCQSYRGTSNQNSLTDLAVGATGGQVMESSGGVVAATQYSASTGGFTAPGAFPGVPDIGDSVCVPGACNPSHTWTASIPVSTIDATWPQLGTLQSISITGRNGDGEWGGRVTGMTLIGSNQNVSMTGDGFIGALGLKSDWFTTRTTLSSPAVGIAPTRDGHGYWVGGSSGGIYGFGNASFQGSADGTALTRPVVGMAATPDGQGYWMVASDGGVFSYGDAGFHGSTGNLVLNKPIVGMAATPDGQGYWLVASDGGIFSFGDAKFYGSTGNIRLNKPVAGMAAAPDGQGYWMVASDGGIFSFGDAGFHGSTGNLILNKPVVGMAGTPDGQGYWMVASDGGLFTFGSAAFYGSAAG